MSLKANTLAGASIHLALMSLTSGFEKDEFLTMCSYAWDRVVKEKDPNLLIQHILADIINDMEAIKDEYTTD